MHLCIYLFSYPFEPMYASNLCSYLPLSPFDNTQSLTQSPNLVCTYYEQLKAETKRHTDVFGGADSYDDRFDEYNNCKHSFFIYSFFFPFSNSGFQNNFYFVDCVVLWCGVVCVLFCVAMYDIVSFRRILVEGFKNRISNNRDKFDVIR